MVKPLSVKDILPEEESPDLPLSSSEPITLSSETIEQKVAQAAYFKAEKRGFIPGFEEEDWLEAEREVKAGFPKAGEPKGGV